MNDCKTEILTSGRVFNDHGEGCFSVSGKDKTISVGLKREDIARMYGIAYPTKRRTGECCNIQSETTPDQVTNVPDINVGDIPLTAIVEKNDAENPKGILTEGICDNCGDCSNQLETRSDLTDSPMFCPICFENY